MFEDLWNGILELTAKFVIPDWNSVVAMLPVLIFAASVVVIVATLWKLLRAPKPLRGKHRIGHPTARRPHAGSFVGPVFAAIGASCCSSVSSGGAVLILGAIGFALTALLAGRVSRSTTAMGATAPPLPAVVHDGPPRPHARPVVPAFLAAIGLAMLLLGLVFGGGSLQSVSSHSSCRCLAGCRRRGVRQDRRGRHDRPSRGDAGSADTEVAADLSGGAARGRLRDPGRLDPAARQRRW